jgi:NADH:ubiquinone oxidoreductase subunit 6 (subunit J)
MAEVIFFFAAVVALAGAAGTVVLRNPFYSVLALVCHLLGLAALFLLLRAEFVAAAQVIVYAGAVMVLYVFVVAYVGGQDRPLGPRHGPGMRAIALLFSGALLVEIGIAVIGSGLSVLDQEGGGFFPAFGSPGEIGKLFLTKFLLAFEIASLLLLVAAVGAVILARRRSGLEDARELSVADLLRSPESGTLPDAERGSLQEAAGPPGR